MKISYHRRKKIKLRRISLRNLLANGIDDLKELSTQLKVTIPTIKKDLLALNEMKEEDFIFQKRDTSHTILTKKDTILRMLDDEEYYTKEGEINISKITKELKTSRSTVLSVLNGE